MLLFELIQYIFNKKRTDRESRKSFDHKLYELVQFCCPFFPPTKPRNMKEMENSRHVDQDSGKCSPNTKNTVRGNGAKK